MVNDDLHQTLFDATSFDTTLAENTNRQLLFRAVIEQAKRTLAKQFEQGTPVSQLVHARAWFIDQLLTRAWRIAFNKHGTNSNAIALVAVGGYGRGELHPSSDIDILILLPNDIDKQQIQATLENFVTFLWDIGLEIGHSARTLSECLVEAEKDITVATNMMEARLISGPPALFEAMRHSTGPGFIWPTRLFFEAKWKEQIQRHLKFHDTAYNLEPNVKEGPGGLRDIQMIGWVTKRHFGDHTLHDLVTRHFLTESEYQKLIEGQEFLWKVRFALHILTGRREDRLLFDYQRTLASQLGYHDESSEEIKPKSGPNSTWSRAADGHRLGVELFMKQYYRTIMELGRLNEMLLQLYQEAILYANDPAEPVQINRRFRARKGFLEVSDDSIFERYPFALLEVFLLLEQHNELKGVSAATIRLIRTHCHLINDDFRLDIRCRSLFMEVMRQPHGITHELRRMNRYGVLEAYIPAFSRIVGLMQYDLFHVYTVDQHTLFLVRNLRRFTVDEFTHEFPLCSSVIKTIAKPELLYLAGLFHDIAKGRGGDHSTLGAVEAREFCLAHDLSVHDSELVAWLVQSHLLMSLTAQHKDIDDPQIIHEFARKVEDQQRLDYLYLLTVADMRATNPKLWNGWKDSLLKELYNQTKRALARGLENPQDKRERIRETQFVARNQLSQLNLDLAEINALWAEFDNDYFIRYDVASIVWQTQQILAFRKTNNNVALVRLINQQSSGSSELFVYAPVRNDLFACVTATLSNLALNIVEARLFTTQTGYTLDTYSILEQYGDLINTADRVHEIEERVCQRIKSNSPPVLGKPRDAGRQIEHFSIPSAVFFTQDERNKKTILEVVATDRPGLLSRIAFALMESNALIHAAKISTFGAQVEDVFFITNAENQPILDADIQQQLKQTITSYLEVPQTRTATRG